MRPRPSGAHTFAKRRMLSPRASCPYCTPLYEGFGDGELFAHVFNFLANFLKFRFILAIFERLEHELGDAAAFPFFKSARGDGWRAKAYTRRIERWARIVGNRIFVERDADLVERFFSILARNTERAKDIGE